MKIEEALMSQLLVLQAAFKSLQDEMFSTFYTEDDGTPIPENIERDIKLNDIWNDISDAIELLEMTPEKKEV